MQIRIGNLTIIGSDNGLLPDRRQAIILTNAGILLKLKAAIYISFLPVELTNIYPYFMYTSKSS